MRQCKKKKCTRTMYKQMKLLAHLMKLLTDYYQFFIQTMKKKCDGNMNSYMNCVTMTEFFILLQLG